MRCIALGCTSGYDSNPEKVKFYRVPKDIELSKLWQKNSKRNDIVLNSSHAFCEKHFAEGDIIKKKVFRDSNGKIVHEEPLKRFYLRDGAVPTLFPWVELPITTKKQQMGVSENSKIQSNSDDGLTFAQIKSNDKLHIPTSWTKQLVSQHNKEAVLFNKISVINIEEMKFTNEKQIMITKDLKVYVKLLGHKVEVSKFQFTENDFKSMENLANFINIVDKCNICRACTVGENQCSSVALKENKHILRHKECPILIERSKRCCEACKSLYVTLNKRKRQQSSNEQDSTKLIRLDKLTPSENKVFDDLCIQKNDILRTKYRITGEIKKLQEQLNDAQDKQRLTNEKKLLNIVKNKKVSLSLENHHNWDILYTDHNYALPETTVITKVH